MSKAKNSAGGAEKRTQTDGWVEVIRGKPKLPAAVALGRLGGKAKRNRSKADYVRAAKLRWARVREAKAKALQAP